MNKIKFAVLMAYIQRLIFNQNQLSYYEVEEIEKLIKEGMEDTNTEPKITTTLLHYFIRIMHKGENRTEAIKLHHMMTGYALKESKNFIDSCWRGPITS